MNENISTDALEAVAVDTRDLASNIADVAQDCVGGMRLASAIQDNFPVVSRLLSTRMSRYMRDQAENGLVHMHKEKVGDETKWVMPIPATVYSLDPTDTSNECCWVPFDLDKCASVVPLNLLCLKDCENLEDIFASRIARFNSNETIPGIANRGETLASAKLRMDKLSMAFFTARNIMYGLDGVYTKTLKPFHGLLAVMENPAVSHIDGTNIMEAFDLLGCRLAILGGNQWFAVHPMIYAAIDAAIYPDERGNLPEGWSKDGGLKFYGRPFVQDPSMLLDPKAGTGEVWLIDDDTTGAFMATDLMPTEDFIRRSGVGDTVTPDNHCGAECMYMYNMGTAFAQDANKLAVITDVPVKAGCVDAIADLAGRVYPETLIPR